MNCRLLHKCRRKEFTMAANTINFNHNSKEIYISASFDKKASKFGSYEYSMLAQVRRDYPDYKIVVKRKGETITYKQMDRYLLRHKPELVEVFRTMIKTEDKDFSGDKFKTNTFFSVRNWFFAQCPEYKRIAKEEVEAEVAAQEATEIEQKEAEGLQVA